MVDIQTSMHVFSIHITYMYSDNLPKQQPPNGSIVVHIHNHVHLYRCIEIVCIQNSIHLFLNKLVHESTDTGLGCTTEYMHL